MQLTVKESVVRKPKEPKVAIETLHGGKWALLSLEFIRRGRSTVYGILFAQRPKQLLEALQKACKRKSPKLHDFTGPGFRGNCFKDWATGGVFVRFNLQDFFDEVLLTQTQVKALVAVLDQLPSECSPIEEMEELSA